MSSVIPDNKATHLILPDRGSYCKGPAGWGYRGVCGYMIRWPADYTRRSRHVTCEFCKKTWEYIEAEIERQR